MPAPTMRGAVGVDGWGTFAEVETKVAPDTFDEVEADYVGLTFDEAEARLAAVVRAATMIGRR